MRSSVHCFRANRDHRVQVLTVAYNWLSQLSGEVLVNFREPVRLHKEHFAGGGRECQHPHWYRCPTASKSSP